MNKTKAKILSTSKDLFNEKGFTNVTIRMIAQELNMSSGNLNYHFKKREDILEALYFEMVEVFDSRIEQLGSRSITLESMQQDIFSSMKRMVDYRFFWTDLYNLLKLNKTIKTHFENAYKERYNGCIFLFDYLIKNGIMEPFSFKEESHSLAERMIGFGNNWLYNSYIYETPIDDNYIESQSKILMSLFYPYLTDLGKKQFKQLYPQSFE